MRGRAWTRQVDRLIGVPAVAIGGALRPPSVVERNPRHLAFVMVNAIGDTVLLSGVIADTKAHRPDARLSLVSGPQNEAASRMVPGVDEVIVVDPARPWRAVRAMRQMGADVVIDCAPWARVSALISAFGGRVSIGFETAGQRRAHMFDIKVHHRPDVHQVENLRALVAPIGVESRTLPHLTNLEDPGLALAKPYAVFHGEAGGYRSALREWPLTHWQALAQRTLDWGFHVVVTGVRAEPPLGKYLASTFGRSLVTDLTGRLSLAQTAHVLNTASYVVAVNTGIMHLSAALGVPTVGLSGPTNPSRWGPLGPRSRSVSSASRKCGYLDLGFEHPRRAPDCMSCIPPDEVLAAVRSLVP